MNPSASSNARWKVPEIQSIILDENSKNHSLPFLALTETWLKSYISDAQLQIPGYVVSRCDRGSRVGGGVLLYSHTNIPISECYTFDDSICQALFCKFDTIKKCVAIVYRPPSASVSSFSNLLDFLTTNVRRVNDDSYQFCTLGDFNFPNIQWPSGTISTGGSAESVQSANHLLSFMSDHFFNQYVLCPTRDTNVLDLFMTNDDRLVTHVSSRKTEMSDHNLVDIMISSNPLSSEESSVPCFDENSFRALDFSKADFDKIRQDLHEIDWNMLRSLCSFEEFPVLFTDTLFQVCSSSTPFKKIQTGRPKQIHALRRKKKRLQARFNAISSHGQLDHAQNVKEKLALVHFDIKDAICKDLDRKEQKAVARIKSNPKYFYSYAKSLAKVKSSISMLINNQGNIITDRKVIADDLQNQFISVFSNPDAADVLTDPNFSVPPIQHPLQDFEFRISDEDIIAAIKKISMDSASGPDGIPVVLLKNCPVELCEPISIIWTESFNSGIVPKFYKQAHVSPLYKKGDRAKAVNYRPVALTSHIIKIYERILRETMVKFIEDNEILCNNQHGFRSGRSCLTQLLSHFDDVMVGLTNGADTDAIYLDYAKAFDKVDHRLLIRKLQRYGFHDRIITWIESFLTDRSQHVVLNGISSFAAAIISGVPQGSVLGPLLFILFINDMKICVKNSIIRFFADDTRILKHIFGESDVNDLQEDLDSVILWAKQNNMALHEDKFELMVHKHCPGSALYQLPFIADQMSYTVSTGDVLYPVNELKDLGVIVSSDLSWSPHASDLSSRARAMAAWVLSAFKTRDRTTMITLYKSLVRSHVEYCCPLWNPSKVSDIQQIESVQRTFTSRISGIQHLDYWGRLKSLKLMSLQRRRERYIMLHMWKILHGLSPNDLNIKFSDPSRFGIKAHVPSLMRSSSQRNQSLYDNSFAVIGPRLWNILPNHLHHMADLKQFKHALTEFLNTFPDTPPVSGYSCANRNSMLDWTQNRKAAAQQGRSDNPMTQ